LFIGFSALKNKQQIFVYQNNRSLFIQTTDLCSSNQQTDRSLFFWSIVLKLSLVLLFYFFTSLRVLEKIWSAGTICSTWFAEVKHQDALRKVIYLFIEAKYGQGA